MSFDVTVRRQANFPVDLYYLLDNTGSMGFNLANLRGSVVDVGKSTCLGQLIDLNMKLLSSQSGVGQVLAAYWPRQQQLQLHTRHLEGLD